MSVDVWQGRPAGLRRRRSVALRLLAAVVAPALVALPVLSSAPARAEDPHTVVSLTFDDGHASQYSVLSLLRSKGMAATFYINSDLIGSGRYYLSWSQVHRLYDSGNEVGGHTADHVPLGGWVSKRAAAAEVCSDRTALAGRGLAPVTSFAYPNATVSQGMGEVVRSCGYSSGRGVGDLFGSDCPCPYAEAIPPRDPFTLRTIDSPTKDTTAATLEASVVRAERRGGWVTFVFHGVCDDRCTAHSTVSTATFTRFVDWLATRRHRGTVVRTVGDVVANGWQAPRGALRTDISCNRAPCAGGAPGRSVTVRLAATGAGHAAIATYYTTDGTDPRTSPEAVRYTGPFTAARGSVVRYFSHDAAGRTEQPEMRRLPVLDTPTDTGAPGGGVPTLLWVGALVGLLGLVVLAALAVLRRR